MNIVNVGYDSTNYYVLASDKPRLLIDVGFAGTLAKLQHACKRADVGLKDIPYLLCTHFHPDHAGLASELVRLGMKLIVLDVQVGAVPVLKTWMKPEHQYVDIDLSVCTVLKLSESRAFLARIGVEGELVHTPGHSDDSVSLVMGSAAFTGDLGHPMVVDASEQGSVLAASWERLRGMGITTIYPGHGPMWRLR